MAVTPAQNELAAGLIKNIECFALDMDGTIYLGERWIDGAREFLRALTASGRKYVFLTNNSSRNARAYVEKLARMGLEIDPATQLVTSGHATIDYLKRAHAGKRIFLLGNELLREEFVQSGLTLDDDAPEVAVTAFDTSLDYVKMCKICEFVRRGLPFVATHPDYNCPTEDGFVPDIGAIHAFIHASTGRWPDIIIGKPGREIMRYTLAMTGTAAQTTAMVGDRLYTDIAAGVNSGMLSILVLSGEATEADLANSDVQPQIVFDSVADIIQYL